MTGSRIVGLGHHQPDAILTNDDLAAMVDTNDTWIRERTGIATRHVAREESVTDMAVTAAGKALAAAGLAPSDVDHVVVATCSAIDRVPSIAAQVARHLGVPEPAAYDLNNGCAGFCTALATADLAIRGGAARTALVIGAEKMSDVTDWTDRSTCVLLGDGAGAAVLSGSDEAGVGPVVWGSDPGRGDAVLLAGAWRPRFRQEGQTVFRWATTEMVPVAQRACERAGISPSDLGAVVTHQANLRIIEAIVRRLGADDAVIARDVVDSGNTSAASVPLAMSKLAEQTAVAPGTPTLLLGFGGGLSWAGQVVTFP